MKQQRQNKMDARIQEIISEKIHVLTLEVQQDYWLITVNMTRLAPDMSYIDVFVSSIKNQEVLCKTLAKYAQEIKEELRDKIILRKTPIIRFRYDTSMEDESRIISKINALEIPEELS